MDAARARRIAAALPSAMERAYAWTFLADGFLTVDRAAARAAVDQALRELDAQDPVDWTQMLEPNPAASILPLVERIAPERLAEVFWRAVALQASSDDPRADFGHDHPLTAEALLLARYDRAVAAALFEPVGAFVRSRPLRGKNDLSPAILLGLACLDPNEAVKVVESLLPARTLSINEPANYARVNLAEYLAMPTERRWMRIWRFHAGCGIAMFEEIYRDLSFE